MSPEVFSWPELQQILLDVAKGLGWWEAGHLKGLGCCQQGPGSLQGLKGPDAELLGPLPVFVPCTSAGVGGTSCLTPGSR